jgi:hypothetical protein
MLAGTPRVARAWPVTVDIDATGVGLQWSSLGHGSSHTEEQERHWLTDPAPTEERRADGPNCLRHRCDLIAAAGKNYGRSTRRPVCGEAPLEASSTYKIHCHAEYCCA